MKVYFLLLFLGIISPVLIVEQPWHSVALLVSGICVAITLLFALFFPKSLFNPD